MFRKFFACGMAALVAMTLTTSASSAQSGDTGLGQGSLAAVSLCPSGWVTSNAPGGCSPEFLTMKVARLAESDDCPDMWVRSSAPGGCSPGFFTMALHDVKGTVGCPDGWVQSSAPGGCSPGYLTLKMVGLTATEGCPDGWIESSAPGGCSPEGFMLETREIYQARYTCAFGAACDVMVDAILALGGTCERDGPDSTCDLPPLVEDE